MSVGLTVNVQERLGAATSSRSPRVARLSLRSTACPL